MTTMSSSLLVLWSSLSSGWACLLHGHSRYVGTLETLDGNGPQNTLRVRCDRCGHEDLGYPKKRFYMHEETRTQVLARNLVFLVVGDGGVIPVRVEE